VELGFCLAPDDKQRLINSQPNDVKAFTDSVFIAEGLNPESADKHLYRQVKSQVEAAFSGAEDLEDN
jgi:hypothetical protein